MSTVEGHAVTRTQVGAVGPRVAAGASIAVLVTLVAVIGQWVLVGIAPPSGDLVAQMAPTDLAGSVVALVLATFGALVIARGDTRRYGWLMLMTGLTQSVVAVAGHYSLYGLEIGMPLISVAVWIQDLWMVPGMLGLLLLPSLFPDGHFAAGGWRTPVIGAGIGWAVLIVVFVFADRPATNFLFAVDRPPRNPAGVLLVPEIAINTAWLGLSLASLVIAGGSLITRWRRAGHQLRQ